MGVRAILVITWLVMLGGLGMILRLVKTNWFETGVILIFGSVMAGGFWKAHPLVFATTLMIWMVVGYIGWSVGRPRWLWIWPVAIVLFERLAGAYVAIALIYCAGMLVWELVMKRASELRQLAIVTGLTLILGLTRWFSLGGWRMFGGLVEVVTGQKPYSNLAGMLLATNYNYLRNYPSTIWYVIFLVFGLVVLGWCTWWLVRDTKRFLEANFRYLPLVGFLWLGLIWVRFIPMAAICTLPLAAGLLKLGQNKKWLRMLAAGGVMVAFIAIAGNQPAQIRLPVEQLKIIKDHKLQNNLLPSVDLVGYLFYQNWPGKGYLDMESEMFDEGDLVEAFGNVESFPEGYMENIVRTYDIRTILVNRGYDFLITYMGKSPEWALIYFDTNGVLFVRKDTVSKEFLAENELKFVDFSRNLGFDPEQVVKARAELEKFTGKYPGSVLAWGQLATIYRLLGKNDLAKKALFNIGENQWNYAVKTEMARIMAAQGSCREAEKWFLEAIKERGEQNLSRTVLDLAVLYAACFEDSEKARHYFARYNSYPIPPAERQKAWQIAKQFGIKLE